MKTRQVMKTKRDQQRDMFPCVAADKLIHAAEMTALLSHTRVVRVNWFYTATTK